MKENKYCECCGQKITDYKVTLTQRNVIWLLALGLLSRKQKNETGNPYVNYKDVHSFVKEHFQGKVVSSYAVMSKYPWNLIQTPSYNEKQFNKSGCWKLTKIGYDWLSNRVALPEYVWFNPDGAYEISDKTIYAKETKDIKFFDLINTFKTF